MQFYLFNSDTDLALANGNENYMAPQSIRKMAEDLVFLPMWYATPGNYSFSAENIIEVSPWGWNRALVKSLCRSGISADLLPDEEGLKQIRKLAHRSVAANLLNELLPVSDHFCGSPTELFTLEEVETFFRENSDCIFKAPLSGSGRGLFICRNEFNYFARQWSKNTLSAQGSIIAEVFYQRVKDFALQFYADGKGRVSFAGYSLFYTDVRGIYKGNLLASNEEIEQQLCEYISVDDLFLLKEELSRRLTKLLAAKYKGFLGVDMMICTFLSGVKYRIHPCVEINLRMTMGMVARRIFDNHVSPNSRGIFRIEYYADPQKLRIEHASKKKLSPLKLDNGRISEGYTALTPILDTTNYMGMIEITTEEVDFN